MQKALGLALETGRAREMAGVDLRLQLADAFVQAAQQLFVDRVTRRVEVCQAATQGLRGIEQRRTAQFGRPRNPLDRSRDAFAALTRAPLLRPQRLVFFRRLDLRLGREVGFRARQFVAMAVDARRRFVQQRQRVRDVVETRDKLLWRRSMVRRCEPAILQRATLLVYRRDFRIRITRAAADRFEQILEPRKSVGERRIIAARAVAVADVATGARGAVRAAWIAAIASAWAIPASNRRVNSVSAETATPWAARRCAAAACRADTLCQSCFVTPRRALNSGSDSAFS